MKRPQRRFRNDVSIDPEEDSLAEVMQDLETLRYLLDGDADIGTQAASDELAEIIWRLDKLTGIDFYRTVPAAPQTADRYAPAFASLPDDEEAAYFGDENPFAVEEPAWLAEDEKCEGYMT